MFVWLIAGASPIESVPPSDHDFVHYPACVRMFDIFKLYWLMVFESLNKNVKSLIGNKNHLTTSTTNKMIRDAGARTSSLN